MQTAIVKVGLLSFLEEIPAFTPPVSSLPPLGAGVEGTDEGSLSFGGANIPVTGAATSESNSAGGANNGAAGEESASISAGGTAVFYSGADFVQSGFAQGNESTSSPITNPNILWGAVATAALGATLADWQRKREEEQARKRAEAPAQEKKGGGGKKTPGQRAYEKKMKQKRIVGESQMLLNEKAEQQAASQRARDDYRAGEKAYDIAQAAAIQQQARDDYRAGERAYSVQQAEKAELQAGLSAYYEGGKKGEERETGISRLRVKTSPPSNPLTPFIGVNTPYDREIALERYRIGEQNPNLSLGETAAIIAQRKYKINDSNYYQFGYGGSPGSNCSNFVSQIWWAAGVRFPGSTWVAAPLQKINGIFPFATLEPLQQRAELQELLHPWFGTPQQQALFSAYNGEFRIVYNGDVPTLLRDELSFNKIMAKYPQVFPSGAAVFYNDGSWTHSAILTNPSAPGTNLYYDDTSILPVNRPAIVEQDGKFDYLLDEEKKLLLDNDNNPIRDPNPIREIRSLDDTNNPNITQVSIVPITPINLEAHGFDVSQMSPTTVDGSTASCYTIEQGSQTEYSLQVCLPMTQP